MKKTKWGYHHVSSTRKVHVATWTKYLAIQEISRMPGDAGENVFEGDDERTDVSCHVVSCDNRGDVRMSAVMKKQKWMSCKCQKILR